MERMSIRQSGWQVVVPPGTYFLGDPCYPFSHDTDTWQELGADSDWFQDSPVAHAKGFDVLGFGTAYGDGEYPDQFGNWFGVDAGMIGLVPQGAWETDRDFLERCGIIVRFDHPTQCFTDGNGLLQFGHYTIDTADGG